MKNESIPINNSNVNEVVLVDFDFQRQEFDKKSLNQEILGNVINKVNELVNKIETSIKHDVTVLNSDAAYRKKSLYITLFLMLILFIFAIVGGATEMYYFFYIAIGIFFIKTTIFTIANFVYFNKRFNEALISMKTSTQQMLDGSNNSPEFKKEEIACGFQYGRVVNEKNKDKITFYRKIKVYLLFYKTTSNIDIDEF